MEEKQKACRDILLSSPPGQFDYILNELIKINHTLEKDWIENIRNEYNVQQKDENMDELATLLKSQWKEKSDIEMSIKCESNQYHIYTSLENIQYNNCHCGSWVATYVYDGSVLKGNVKLYVFYYENGNIHAQSEKAFEASMKSNEDLNVMAKSIVDQMNEWETTFMRDLYDMYYEMSQDLKSMRRVLPMSRVKMDWSMTSHRMAKTLNQTKKSFA